jgi:radical SAM protein with 4Fe4S-binding SPASM domain
MEENYYFKSLRNNQVLLWRNISPLLTSLDMELTERCNNNCIHCYINLPANNLNAKRKELLTEEIKKILKEAVSLGCIRVRFTGGEPLLRDDFEEIYLYTRKLGLKVILFTNATLLTNHLTELLVHIPPLELIEITVFGMKRKSYEAVTRNPGSFDAAWKSINLLLEKKVPFVVKGVLLPPNRKEIEELEAWSSKIRWMDGRPAPFTMFFDLRGRRDFEARNILIKKLRPSHKNVLKFFSKRREEYFKKKKEFYLKFLNHPNDKLFSCGAGIRTGCVDAYGNFQPCILLRHPNTIYDLKSGSLKDAITNFFPKIRRMRAKNPDYLSRCAQCFLKDLCRQCPAKSWTEAGALDTPVEYICEITHIQAKFLGLLEDGEQAWEIRDWKDRLRKTYNNKLNFKL